MHGSKVTCLSYGLHIAQEAFQYTYTCYKTDAAQSYSQPCFNGQAGWTQDLVGNLLIPANTWLGEQEGKVVCRIRAAFC